MQSLKIEIPKGYEASFDSSSGEIKFRSTVKSEKTVMERILTLHDILDDHGITQKQFEEECEGLSEDERAYRILKLLAGSLNEGWKPNWKNSYELKYFPWFEMDGSSGFRFDVLGAWYARSSVGSRLCFKSRELAVHACTYFLDTYKQFMTL